MNRHRKAESLPSLMADLTLASWESLARRTLLIAQNKCSKEEYQRMILEKAEATIESSMTFFLSGGLASMEELIEPWRSRVNANVTRLRKM